jgi:cytoskeleton protein RodZ
MEPVEAIGSPGKYLKTRRESQRLSLNKVAKETRIRETILRGIEEDKYEDLPDLYVKSFLSAYAGYLGLDPNEVILLHQKYVKNLPPSKGQVPKYRPVSAIRRVNIRLLVIAISALLLAALLVYASFELLPRVFPSLWTQDSGPSSSSSVSSSSPVKKETEPSTTDQPGTNESQSIAVQTREKTWKIRLRDTKMLDWRDHGC